MWGYATILFVTTCDYVSFATTFATMYQFHQIWGGFATILQTNAELLSSSSSNVNVLGLYSFMNKLKLPINYMCNHNFNCKFM